MGKKPIVSVTYENERISLKISLPHLKSVLRLSCVVHGPIYGRFTSCDVAGLLLATKEIGDVCTQASLLHTYPISLHTEKTQQFAGFSVVTPFKIDQNKNQNHLTDRVQNLGNERR